MRCAISIAHHSICLDSTLPLRGHCICIAESYVGGISQMLLGTRLFAVLI